MKGVDPKNLKVDTFDQFVADGNNQITVTRNELTNF